jgi:hypothetical protein
MISSEAQGFAKMQDIREATQVRNFFCLKFNSIICVCLVDIEIIQIKQFETLSYGAWPKSSLIAYTTFKGSA